MSEVIDPNIPSVPDPFDLTDCSELPFPLTPTEDQILKHILRICGSDLQMAKRAYDSIICMWSKKIIDTEPPTPPELLIPILETVTPSKTEMYPHGEYIYVTATGQNIMDGAVLLCRGVAGPNPAITPTSIA